MKALKPLFPTKAPIKVPIKVISIHAFTGKAERKTIAIAMDQPKKVGTRDRKKIAKRNSGT